MPTYLIYFKVTFVFLNAAATSPRVPELHDTILSARVQQVVIFTQEHYVT